MTASALPHNTPDQRIYRRRINAWALYDVANSAFFTTILAAVLPTYYSAVAGATLPSAAIATRNWSLSLSLALAIAAVISPVLGTISDIVRGKKAFLAAFTAVGVLATGLLVLVGTGDWLLASVMIVVARVGAAGANVFYDALLPHVAREEDQDAVSSRGYALGYLGGGVLLAINVVMINVIPDNTFGFPFEFAGVRLSFFSVALWWALFTLPLLFLIPEPQTAGETLRAGQNPVTAGFAQLAATLREISNYRELFKYLIAFLIYNDGIGTIIGVAVIYGAELGFETTQLILALLLVQFAGIPFSFVFGSLPNPAESRRHYYLAFILVNVIALPALAISARTLLPQGTTGAPPALFETVGDFQGEGVYGPDALNLGFGWETQTVAGDLLDAPEDVPYAFSSEPNVAIDLPFNGRRVAITYAAGPSFAPFAVFLDGEELLAEDGVPLIVTDTSATDRYGVTLEVAAEEAGEHQLLLRTLRDTEGTVAIQSIEVLPAERGGDLGLILGALLALEVVAVGLAFVLGPLVRPLADTLDTKRSILLALLVYAGVSTWGFFLNSTVEFWYLAMIVAVVQGGSQALSRSLYASMSPAAKSGEFFGLYSIMAKFSAITGPLLFAGAVQLFGNSRPAILSIIVLFAVGGFLLSRVDVEAGRAVAKAENARAIGS